jgi:hypothetical protein
VSTNYGGGNPLGNYALTAAIDTIPVSQPHPATDFFGNARPEPADPTNRFDPGAVEYGSVSAVAVLSVTGGPLNFGNEGVGNTSIPRTLTLHNTGGAGATTIAVAFASTPAGGFSRPAGAAGGTCGVALPAGSTCTINVVFTPTSGGAYTGTATITANMTVSGSPVTLTGNGVGSLSFTNATNGTLGPPVLGIRALTFTIPTPRAPVTSVVTITATGAPVQITAETVTGILNALFTSTGTTCSLTTPLAAGSSCTINVTYATPAARPVLPNLGDVSVTNPTGIPNPALLLLMGQ